MVARAAAWGLSSRPPPPVAAMPVPTVAIAQPLVRQVTEWDDYVGRFEANRSVELRSRISGAIPAVRFTDGAIVRKGQLLFTIDPCPRVAAMAEARAPAARSG